MHNHCDSGKYGIRTSYFLWNDHSEFDYRNPSWICIGTGFLFSVDYSRTERVQFEDDEYYYYVKAVPKVVVATPRRQ